MLVRINLCRNGNHRGHHVPRHRFGARPGELPPGRDDRGADDDERQRYRARGDDAAEAAQQFHETITGTPVALPASTSNCAGSVVNWPSSMVLFEPW